LIRKDSRPSKPSDLSEIINSKSITHPGYNFGHALRVQPSDGVDGVRRVVRIANDYSALIDCVGHDLIPAKTFEELQPNSWSSVEGQVARASLIEANDLAGVVDCQRLCVDRAGNHPKQINSKPIRPAHRFPNKIARGKRTTGNATKIVDPQAHTILRAVDYPEVARMGSPRPPDEAVVNPVTDEQVTRDLIEVVNRIGNVAIVRIRRELP